MCVLVKSQTLAAAALNKTQGSQNLICFLEKLFPQDWQAYCFLMRQQKLENFGRRELNVYFLLLKEAAFLVPSRERCNFLSKRYVWICLLYCCW